MRYFPIWTDLHHKECLVIGGGDIALRKIILLKKAHAHITCITKSCLPEIEGLADEVIIKEFEESDIDRPVLVISATDDEDLNSWVASICNEKNIFVNVVDSPALCTFTMGSLVDRSPIVISISSAGAAPVIARLLRAKLEAMLPAAYGKLGTIAENFRNQVKAKFSNLEDRRYFWESVFGGSIAEKVFAGKEDEAQKDMEQLLADTNDTEVGEVYLVGGGPGDPDLLTFKALRLMQQADIILYDRLVSKEVMELVRRDAELVYVGKERANHAVPQGGINQLLVKYAKEGRRVCRLKGGDPFIFGRGGEEIEELAQHNIPFQVVPGITAASGCSAYSGIPLTHRDYSQSARFIAGHLKDGTMNLPWSELAVERQTLVFYMALVGAKVVSEQLIAHGMDKDMPVALIERGTTKDQKVKTTTLERLPITVDKHDIKPPTLLIIGRVVTLRDKLKWFEAPK